MTMLGRFSWAIALEPGSTDAVASAASATPAASVAFAVETKSSRLFIVAFLSKVASSFARDRKSPRR